MRQTCEAMLSEHFLTAGSDIERQQLYSDTVGTPLQGNCFQTHLVTGLLRKETVVFKPSWMFFGICFETQFMLSQLKHSCGTSVLRHNYFLKQEGICTTQLRHTCSLCATSVTEMTGATSVTEVFT